MLKRLYKPLVLLKDFRKFSTTNRKIFHLDRTKSSVTKQKIKI